MQDQHTFIQKTFELTNELTGKLHTFSIQVIYIASTREINISRAITSICSQGLSLNNCQIFYQDFSQKVYVFLGTFPFKHQIYLRYDLFLDSAIKLKFKNVGSESVKDNMWMGAIKKQGDPLKKKVKERTIREASEFVKRWRNLYQTVDYNGRRLYTLETAANEVGLAKKTLDDYYYQLRQAQRYGFNFQQHKNDKIGVLRKFVKDSIRAQQRASIGMSNQDDIDRYLASSSDSQEERRYR